MKTVVAVRKFRAWVATLGCSRKELAERLGCDPSYLAHLIAGRHTPGLALAARIENITLGAIRCRDWVEPAPPESAPEPEAA